MTKDCSKVKTIEDVTDLWEYEDTNGGGKNDGKWVSCGQDGSASGYNELKDKYTKYYSTYSEEAVAKAMCQCCNELKKKKTNITWSDFYECMEDKGYKKD
jgi:hypothetical protein